MELTIQEVIGILGAKLAEKELENTMFRMEVERLRAKYEPAPANVVQIQEGAG